jgi:hypothetical protein
LADALFGTHGELVDVVVITMGGGCVMATVAVVVQPLASVMVTM